MLASWKKSNGKPRQCIKKKRHYFANKNLYGQSYGFSSGHVWMWELDREEGWAPKNLCFCTVMMKKTLERPLDCKEMQLVDPKGNQPWIFIWRTDAEAEAPVHWPDSKSQLTGKESDAGKIEGGKRRGWQRTRWLDGITNFNGHEFERAPEDSGGQGSLACCSARGDTELVRTEGLNSNDSVDR